MTFKMRNLKVKSYSILEVNSVILYFRKCRLSGSAIVGTVSRTADTVQRHAFVSFSKTKKNVAR